MQEQCPLLTGDKRLRDAANQESVPVHGTLWLIARLMEERKVTVDDAEQAYNFMRREGRRLPWGKVAAQIKQLRGRPWC